MTKNTKMMWGCVALVAVALVVASVSGAYFLLFALPCMLMMGGMGGGSRGGEK